MVRVALYARVSTEEQAKEGFSLPAQLSRMRAHAVAQGWEVVGEYVDEGHSARTTKRPAYQRMMEEAGRWDAILVLKMDRIHRNSKNFLQMLEDLQEAGKCFASVTEYLDTGTAMGRFVMGIISGIAQLESEVNGERVIAGMQEKALQGGFLGGHAPYGYHQGDDGRLVVVEEEARHVREMFTEASILSVVDVAARLNAKGVRTRKGNRWTYWNVNQILNNPVYHGHTQWGPPRGRVLVRGTHPAIVPEAPVPRGIQ